jgi:hypothetical protein
LPVWGGLITANPAITTTTVNLIDSISAKSGGTITSDGGNKILARGICWNTLSGPTIANNKTTDGSDIGTYISSIGGLLPVTTYYVRAYAMNNVAITYGNEISFTTTAEKPTVSPTTAATLITGTTATSGGNITKTGGATITERGICYWTTANPTILNTKVIDPSPGTGVFSSNITGLTGYTTYYVRAYATNSSGTNYGTQISFTTLIVPPTLVTAAATSITGSAATSGGSMTWNGGGYSNYQNYGVAYDTIPGSSNPKLFPTNTSNGSVNPLVPIGPWVTNITGLTANKTYYIRSFLDLYNVTPFVGWVRIFGNELSFTTATPVAPVIASTTAATVTSANTATSGGAITSDGGSPVTAKGVCWSTSSSPVLGAGNFTTDGTGTASFVSSITGLTSNTIYYVRAYATNSVGTSYGPADVTFTTWIQAPYTLFQNLGYGIVGYVAADGTGFIVSPDIASTAPWGCSGTTIATGTAIGTGLANTNLILANCATRPIAASVAAGYTGGGFNDWYLPSSEEWLQIATNYTRFGFPGGYVMYLTSSAASTTYATSYFYTGSQAYGSTSPRAGGDSFATYIRAIRSFSAAAKPTVTTSAISNIGADIATGGGNVTSDGGAPILAEGVCWSITTGPTVALSTKTVDGAAVGPFISNISGLAISTTYYVRAYATNIAGTSYGAEVSFTTTSPTVPVLSTDLITAAGGTVATSGGNITSDGGSPVTARGVCWGTSTGPTIALTTKTVDGSGTGAFVSSLTGLNVGTTYYVRAYATNSIGTAYGNEVSFTQVAVGLPLVTTTPISNIIASNATGGGDVTSDGGSAITAAGVVWSTVPVPVIGTANQTYDGFGIGPFISNIWGLAGSTTYYVRAYATNINGTSYGTELSFTTTAPSLPVITTDVMGSLIGSVAEGNYTITSDGGSPILAIGLCWNTATGPTIANFKNDDITTYIPGFAPYTYPSLMTGLTINTTYYVRAYARNALGITYGSEVSFIATAATIGQPVSINFMSGSVINIDINGSHGLIALGFSPGQPADWGCTNSSVVTSAAVGTGSANTDAIITDIGTNGCTSAAPVGAFAAQMTKFYGVDWYLPSKAEVDLLVANGGSLGLTFPLWSSTELNATDAYYWDGASWLTGAKTY